MDTLVADAKKAEEKARKTERIAAALAASKEEAARRKAEEQAKAKILDSEDEIDLDNIDALIENAGPEVDSADDVGVDSDYFNEILEEVADFGDFGDFEEKNCKIKEMMNYAAEAASPIAAVCYVHRPAGPLIKKSVNIIYCAQCTGL